VQAALSLTLALITRFEQLVILANVPVLFVYLGCAAAAWQLRRKNIRDDMGAMIKPIPGSGVAAPLASLVIIALLTSITRKEWLAAGLCCAVGVLLYAASPAGWLRSRRSIVQASK